MALPVVTKVFGVNDAAVYKLSTDPPGAPPTYASKIDLVGIKSMETTVATDTKQLRGDNTLLAADSIIKEVSGKVEFAKYNLDVWSAITSMTQTATGTTPNQKVVMTLSQADTPAYFKVETQTKQVDMAVTGDVHYTLYKCMPGNLPLGNSEEDYRIQSIDFISVPLIGTITGGPANAWVTATLNETAAAIT